MEHIDEAEVVRLYCEEQLSLVDIARRFGRGTALIRQCLEDRGVRIRTAWERHAADFDLEQARRLYVDEGLTLEQVGAAVGCSMTTSIGGWSQRGSPDGCQTKDTRGKILVGVLPRRRI